MKTTYCKWLNAEADIRTQLYYKVDIVEICKNVKQYHSSKFICLVKYSSHKNIV